MAQNLEFLVGYSHALASEYAGYDDEILFKSGISPEIINTISLGSMYSKMYRVGIDKPSIFITILKVVINRELKSINPYFLEFTRNLEKIGGSYDYNIICDFCLFLSLQTEESIVEILEKYKINTPDFIRYQRIWEFYLINPFQSFVKFKEERKEIKLEEYSLKELQDLALSKGHGNIENLTKENILNLLRNIEIF